MIKLYPPYIEGSIPAFYGNVITIPYVMNKTVGYKDISGFVLKINNISTNKTMAILDKDEGYEPNKNEVYFKIPTGLLTIGQFYKIQLAYKDINNDIGIYSTIGVVKYTDQPTINISNLIAGEINLHQYEYYGQYIPSQYDLTEKEYAYQFDIYNYNNDLYYSTGKLIHNASIEDSQDYFEFTDILEEGKIYFIQYTIWTLNKLKVQSRKYRITRRESIDSQVDMSVIATNNFDNGYIDITLQDNSEDKLQYVTGIFNILRSSSENNYATQNEICKFELRNETIADRLVFRDYTIQQGITYIYLIEQYNDNGLYSNPIYSNYVKADFEDMFLFDGERQLKVRFNPKVSSFKADVLEQKVDTIGSKYPFIFRNGDVYYHEFPVSGLISYWEDENQLFLKEAEYGIDGNVENLNRFATEAKAIGDDVYLNYIDKRKNEKQKKELSLLDENAVVKTLNLTGDNIAAERRFKMAVLDWLTNGKAKLFKSPAEGNFLVRLLNSSLTPSDQLGRMLHTFNSTAYEVAECNYKNLLSYGILKNPEVDRTQLQWETIQLAKSNGKNIVYITGKINKYPVVTVQFRDMKPGSIVYVDDVPMTIGIKGYLYLELDHTIKSIIIPENSQYIGYITYSYYGKSKNVFNYYKDIKLLDVPGYQIIGSEDKINTDDEFIDIIKYIENIKNKIVEFFQINFICQHKTKTSEEKDFLIEINGNLINLNEIKHYELHDFNNIKSLRMKKGIDCTCSYQLKIIDYNIEDENEEVREARNLYLNTLTEYLNYLQDYREVIQPKLDKVLTNDYLIKAGPAKIKYLEEQIDNLKFRLINLFINDSFELIDYYEAKEYIENLINPWEIYLDRIKKIIDFLKEDQDNFKEEPEEWNKIQQEIDNYYKTLEDVKEYPTENYSLIDKNNLTLSKIIDEYEKNNDGEIVPKKLYKNKSGVVFLDSEPNAFSLVLKKVEDEEEDLFPPKAYIGEKKEEEKEFVKELETARIKSLWCDTGSSSLSNKTSANENYYIYVPTYIGVDAPDQDIYGFDYTLWLDITDQTSSINELSHNKDNWFIYKQKGYKNLAYQDSNKNWKNVCQEAEFIKKDKIYPFNYNQHYYLHQYYEGSGIETQRKNLSLQVYTIDNGHILEYCFSYDDDNKTTLTNVDDQIANMIKVISKWLKEEEYTWKEIVEEAQNRGKNENRDESYTFENEDELINLYELCKQYDRIKKFTGDSGFDDFTYIPLNDIYEGQLQMNVQTSELASYQLTYNKFDHYFKTKNYNYILESLIKLNDANNEWIKLKNFTGTEADEEREFLDNYIKKSDNYLEDLKNYYNNYIKKLEIILKKEEEEMNGNA